MWKVVTFAVALSAICIIIQAQDLCIICTSSIVQTGCIDPESADLSTSQCPGAPNNRSCFSRVDDGGNVVRGCANQLSNETAAECDSETCQICVGMNMPNGRQGCNYGIFPPHRLWCISCQGGVNSTCAGNTNLTMTVCPIFDPEDQCYVARPDGNYERGCMSSSAARCNDGENCHRCSGQGCNFEDYNSAISMFKGNNIIGIILVGFVFTIMNK